MRVTGAADPTVPVADTLHGKLSQKKFTNKKSTHLQNIVDKKVEKEDISKMNKYDRNILNLFN